MSPKKKKDTEAESGSKWPFGTKNYILLAIAIVLLLAIVVILASGASVADDFPETDDPEFEWPFLDDVYFDEGIEMTIFGEGNLTKNVIVGRRAHITLENLTLRIKNTEPHQFVFKVEAGATLTVQALTDAARRALALDALVLRESGAP